MKKKEKYVRNRNYIHFSVCTSIISFELLLSAAYLDCINVSAGGITANKFMLFREEKHELWDFFAVILLLFIVDRSNKYYVP
jgi:hypothetical protein